MPMAYAVLEEKFRAIENGTLEQFDREHPRQPMRTDMGIGFSSAKPYADLEERFRNIQGK